MKSPLQRDSILTVMGFSLITGVFLFAFYLPGAKANVLVKQEIGAAEESVRNIPLRVAEIQALRADVARRQEYLARARSSVPVDPDIHSVIHQVAELARNSNLQITRLEPRAPLLSESYQRVPFRLSFTGSFRETAAFMKGLESRDRLFSVQQLSVRRKDGKNGPPIEIDMNFSVLIGNIESADSAGNNDSADSGSADTEISRESRLPAGGSQ